MTRSRTGAFPTRAWLVEGIIGLLAVSGLLWAALQRVELGGRPTYLGKYYAMLAADPFHPAPDNPVGHRILAPLLSYLLGFRGPTLLYTNLLMVIVFVAAVYAWLRREGHAPHWAVVGASGIALSMPALTTLHYGGYPDSVAYLFVFAAWWARGRLWLSCVLILLALLTHESVLFLAPWLLVVLARSEEAEHGWRRAAAGMVMTLVVFAGIRFLLERSHPGVAYSAAFYLQPLARDPLHWFRAGAPHGWLGVAAAFNLFWVFPLLAGGRWLRRRRWIPAALILLPIPCALAQLFFAYDVTRLAALAFPSVLLGMDDLLRSNAFKARWWAAPLALANFFIPQVNVAMGVVDAMGAR